MTISFRKCLLTVSLFLGWQAFTYPVLQAANEGFVYVATNEPAGNRVIQYRKASDGSLRMVSQAPTGGLGGTGNGVGALDPLGSQDSVIMNGIGSVLLVVNAGSNEVSSLAAGIGGVQLLSKVPSGGSFPNSVALHNGLVYVLNAHGTPNVSGFRMSSAGTLTPIQSSTRNLPGGASAAPHDVQFSPDGTRLLVTEGGANQIDVFQLDNNGLITGVRAQASGGSGPFGFRFGRSGFLFNVEAATDSLSSYFLAPNDTLSPISTAVPDTQMAACWITLTASGNAAFVSNTGSGTISIYNINANGGVALMSAVAASLNGGAPIDSALSSGGGMLYVVDSAMGRIFSFTVSSTGLTQTSVVSGLPTTVQGIAVD